MYEPLNQPSYTNISYSSTQSFPPTIPDPPHDLQSLSSDHSLSHPSPPFISLSSVPSFSHPPTFNPYIDSGHYPSNHAGFGGPPVNYSGTNNDVTPSWVVKQAAPIKYSPVIQPLRQEAIASTSYAAPMNHKPVSLQLVTNVPKKKLKRPRGFPNKSSVSQNVRCEVCKVECSSVDVHVKHLFEKKHVKGLLKLYAPCLQSAATQASQSANSSGKIVTPDGQGVVGKKHAAKERGRSVNSNPVSVGISKTKAKHNPTKKKKSGESAQVWCVVCRISCTSSDCLKIHLAGKKHQKNVQKLQNSNSSTITTPASTSAPLPSTAAPLPSTNPSTGVEGNTVATKISLPSGESAPVWCVVCKISCTSSDGLKIHFAGKKHQKNVQKLQNSNSSTITTPVSTSAPIPSTAAPLPSTNPSTGVEGNTAATKISLPSGESTPVWCVVCKISCTSSDGLKIHFAGKKHQKNVQKLQNSNFSTITTPVSTSTPIPSTAAPLPSTNQSTGVEGNTAATKISLPSGESAPMWCGVCKISCTSSDGLKIHLAGKKHQKNVQKLQNSNSSTITTPASTSAPLPSIAAPLPSTNPSTRVEGNTVATKISLPSGESAPVWCVVCKISCTSSDGLKIHFAGKKHQKNVQKLITTPVSTSAPIPSTAAPLPSTNPSTGVEGNTAATKISLPSGVSAPVWCVVCKISCTSSDGLKIHLAGKKHQKNVQKLQNSNSSTIITPASNSAPLLSTAAPLPSKNPSIGVVAVRTCTICNVVCNSETVFNSHCAGQRHTAMVKRAEAASSGLLGVKTSLVC